MEKGFLVKCGFVLFLGMMLSGCSDDDFQQNECILETLQFDSLSRLEFTTLSGGRIHQIKQYFDFEGESKVVASFSFSYFKDSLSVRDQLNAANYRYPFLTATYENDRLSQVVKYFPLSEIRLVHKLDYTDGNQLRVELTRVASNGDSLFAAYGLYEFDVHGNVSKLLSYGIDEQDRDNFVLYDEVTFTYDDYLSPVKNLLLPFFTETNVPNVRFFSRNNITSENRDGTVRNYTYEYGAYNSTIKQNTSSAGEVTFGFVNCDVIF